MTRVMFSQGRHAKAVVCVNAHSGRCHFGYKQVYSNNRASRGKKLANMTLKENRVVFSKTIPDIRNGKRY